MKNNQEDLNSRISKVDQFIKLVNKEHEDTSSMERLQEDDTIKLRKLSVERDKASEEILGEMIGRLYTKSIPLDDDYKDGNETMLKNDMQEFMKTRGGCQYYAAEAIKRTKSPLLKRMVESAEDIAKAHYIEPAKNISDISIADLDYKMTDEEDEKIDQITSDMEFDEISTVIKNNVKETIMNEIDKAKEEEADKEKLQSELNENDELTSESAIENAITKYKVHHPRIHEPSLFEAILVSKNKMITESTSDNMDMAFAETIREYTQHTVAKTLRLDSYTPRNITNMVNEYLKK